MPCIFKVQRIQGLLVASLAASYLVVPAFAHACPPGTRVNEQKDCVKIAPGAPLPPVAQKCKDDEFPDPSMGGMCMKKPNFRTSMSLHGTQYVAHVDASGPRGRSAWTAPNMWLLRGERQLTPNHRGCIAYMGDTDLGTVSDGGTPQPGQLGDGHLDAQHPHTTPIMGLEFCDAITLGPDRKLILSFAPRGEATAGIPPFMHRASAEGNMDAPLGHHLQDKDHIDPSVFAARLQEGKTLVGVSVFSGVEPNPDVMDLKMSRPDSYGIQVQRELSDRVTVGGSFAHIVSTHHEQLVAGWVSTTVPVGSGALSTTTALTEVNDLHDGLRLRSALSEGSFQLGKNRYIARAESVDRTPEQLQISSPAGKAGPQRINAATLGAERQVVTRSGYDVALGAAITQMMLPRDFQGAYGGNPRSLKINMRVGFKAFRGWGKIAAPAPAGGGEPGCGGSSGEPGCGPGMAKAKPSGAQAGPAM